MNIKNLIPCLVFALASSIAFSQSPLAKGKTQINVGVGLSEWGIPVYIGLDHGIHPDVTLGAELSYRSYKENWKNYNYTHRITGFSGNINYHFNTLLNIPQNWDFYTGANVGFYAWSTRANPVRYEGSNSSGLGLGAQIGGRYYFSDKLGVNFEFGGGNAFSGGKLGLTIKL